jgi:hypothetical protein
MMRGSPGRAIHGGDDHSDTESSREEDDGDWAAPVRREGTGWLRRCAKELRCWLREQLGEVGVKTMNLPTQLELGSGAREGERRGDDCPDKIRVSRRLQGIHLLLRTCPQKQLRANACTSGRKRSVRHPPTLSKQAAHW